MLLNKADIRKDIASTLLRIEKDCGQKPLVISAKERTGIKKIHQAILEKLPADFGQQTITGNLVKEGDLVLLVMPQDIQAPKGRLILSTGTDDARIIGQEMSGDELYNRPNSFHLAGSVPPSETGL